MYPLLDYDLGDNFNYLDGSGVPTKVATVLQVLPQLTSRPWTATATNSPASRRRCCRIRSAATSGTTRSRRASRQGQDCIQGSPAGGYVAFAETKEARIATNDPRLSLEERYGTHDDYVARRQGVGQRDGGSNATCCVPTPTR